MKINEYNQMMKYLTRPAEPEYEQVAMVGKIKKGADLIKKLVKKGEAPKTDVDKVKSKVEADKKNIQELADEGQIPVKDETIVPEDVITVPEPFKEKYQQEFLAHDALYGRRSGDNKVDAEAIAETVADMQGKVYDDMGYSERMDLYDKAYGYLSLLDRVKGSMKEATGRTLQSEGGRIDFATGGPVMERFLKNVEKVKKFVAMKKEKGEEIYHSDLLKVTGNKSVSANLRTLEKAGVMNDITDLSKGGRGVKQTKIQPFLDQAVDDFYTDKRPINEMRTSSLIPELSKKAGLEKNIGQRNLTKLLMKNPKYVEMIPVRDSVTQSVTKQKGPVKEKLMKMTFQEAKTGDVVAKARPSLPQPKGVEEYILRDLRRYAVQNKNQGALFQITEDAKDFNKLKIFDAESGETLDKAKIKKYIKNNDPRFQEYVDTFKDVRKIKNKKYNDGTLNEALKKIKRGGVDASIQIGHVDGVGVNPLKNLEPQLAFANQAARAKGADFKQLGLQAPGGEGVPRKLTAEENINRFVKFADRSLKTQKPLSTKLYSGISPELGKLSYEVLKDVAKGIPTPLGAVGLNVGLGVDPTSAIDRVGIGAELAFAPELVKQSARFGPTAQRILNLGLKAAPAMRVARIASPLGLLSLAAEGGYQFYQALEDEKARIAAMSPEERQQFEEEQTAAAYMGEAGNYANGGRVEMAGGGLAALKALLNFLGKGRGKKGSELLKEVNPKKYGTVLENLMLPDDKKMIGGFRVEYLESLLDTIKNDKAMLDRIKEMPVDQQESFFNMINQGANKGRLDVYKKINPDEAVLEIEQMIKNLKTKDMSPEEVKRSLNALGGRVGMNTGGFPGDVPDFYAETVNNLDEVYGGASRIEQKILKLKKPRTTQGDEVVAKADAQYDYIKDTAEDLDEF